MALPTCLSFPGHRRKGTQQHALIYFICGNPGLIAFYDDFLGSLSEMIKPHSESTTYDIYGRDLLGFNGLERPSDKYGTPPWNLEAQIQMVHEDVLSRRREDNGEPYDFLVLMGHSVGSYIAVEIAHRHMKGLGSDGTASRTTDVDIRHGVLLFPTLTHIAESPAGRRLTRALDLVPTLPTRLQQIARLFLGPISTPTLAWILRPLLGFSEAAASTVAHWLRTERGVEQALYLGAWEMRTIREERWEEELWEVAKSRGPGAPPRWFVYYAKEDHWVANHIRDEFLRRRRYCEGREGTRMEIVVDEGGVPHAFCTKEGEYKVMPLLG
jgi:pimeloyl-ACP methyl ester carboxylesterase